MSSPRLDREIAIATALEILPPDAMVIAANGHMGRALFRVADRPGAFYMIGSMGLASSIGLGIALAAPERRIAIFDGDGNVLMNLGSLATIGVKRPRHFLHLCFDNETYASTGGQRTISSGVSLERVAEAAGYGYAARADDAAAIRRAVSLALEANGPSFVLMKVAGGGLPPGTPRIPFSPPEMTRRSRERLLPER